ncbi:conserved hypothetical protein [Hyella patelloides LEGE 07179]|uniref:Uncharacterized protein n=1 Tax=Hyella patelloides LEGE 07179 TaxID=945734 RepID=A0A563VRF6_9CYAN|nr:hypothetical protein [Hyella patelloides]VEP13991.1 conserved hypothetical protein [Hyella patelloides LEGE 07179]
MQNEIVTNSNTQLIFLVFGLPIIGLIYCGLGIAAMASFSIIREYALISGLLFILIPFTIAASIWIRASAKAYRR